MGNFENENLEGIYEEKCDLRLENLYNQCYADLSFQQSKRDQIIAFYITIVSLLLPTIYDLNLTTAAAAGVYLLIYVIGFMLCGVIRRYRIYKEVYWITCRVISTLMRVKPEHITEPVLKKLFAEVMRKNFSSRVVMKNNKFSRLATTKRLSFSAETLLYKLLALMANVLLGISVWLSASIVLPTPICAALSIISSVISYTYLAQAYVNDLCKVYAYCIDKKEDSFESAYHKAWFLHSFN